MYKVIAINNLTEKTHCMGTFDNADDAYSALYQYIQDAMIEQCARYSYFVATA